MNDETTNLFYQTVIICPYCNVTYIEQYNDSISSKDILQCRSCKNHFPAENNVCVEFYNPNKTI